MTIGRKADEASYSMGTGSGRQILTTTSSEKDLGVTFENTLSFKGHINAQVKTGNQLVGLVRRSFDYLDVPMMRKVFTGVVRPRLEYGSAIWDPVTKTEKIQLENVQRRATKLVNGLQNHSYGERLRILKLPSLEYRRVRGRMIETYKILHGHYDMEFPWFVLESQRTAESQVTTRGHSMKLFKVRYNNPLKRKAFSHAVVEDWNSLTEDIVHAPSVNAFRNRLDRFWAQRQYQYTEYGYWDGYADK